MQIAGKRLMLRSLTSGDFSFYARLVMDPVVMEYITGKGLTFDEAQDRFRRALLAAGNQQEAGFFAVIRSDDREPVGVVKLVPIDENQAEVGYMLLPEFQGMGYASEALEMLIRLARGICIFDELIGIVDPDNPASIKVLIRQGFTLKRIGTIDDLPAAWYGLRI
jgi:[ribosomal protein S5]-alanine N-acetyltransferase